MMMNRKSVMVGLAGLAIAAALAGGAGIAVAATGTPTAPSTTSSTAPPYGHLGGNGDMGGMSGAGQVGHIAGMAFGENSPMAAAAGYLGLSPTDLQAQLQDGQSLAEVAATHGKSVSGLEDAMLAAMTSNLAANTTLTADQQAARLALVKSHLDAMVNSTPSGAGIGPMGPGKGGMMGR